MRKSTVNDMGTRSMLPLLLSMSYPPMISMLIQSLYNVVDSMYVSRIGQDALTAVSLAFPLQNILLAVSVGMGIGMGSLISRSLGAGNQRDAEHSAAQGLVVSALHSVVFALLSLVVIKPFFRLFASDESICAMGETYAMIVMVFSFGQFFHVAIEKTLQATGNMIVPMLLQAAGAIVNIVLDPVFIFGWGIIPAMGVRGAAIATVIGQISACALALIVLLCKNSIIRLHIKDFRPSGHTILSIYQVGIPSSGMIALSSVLVMGLNAVLARLSAAAVAVFGVYYKIQTFVYMPSNGLIQGARPIISYNYGARDRKRMLQAIKCTMLLTAVMMALGTLLFELCPHQLLSMFAVEEEAMNIGVIALRVIASSYIISSVGVVLAAVFEALGRGGHSLVISLLRQFVITLPLAYICSRRMGLMGVWITFPIAETIAAFVALVLFKKTVRDDPILNGQAVK